MWYSKWQKENSMEFSNVDIAVGIGIALVTLAIFVYIVKRSQ